MYNLQLFETQMEFITLTTIYSNTMNRWTIKFTHQVSTLPSLYKSMFTLNMGGVVMKKKDFGLRRAEINKKRITVRPTKLPSTRKKMYERSWYDLKSPFSDLNLSNRKSDDSGQQQQFPLNSTIHLKKLSWFWFVLMKNSVLNIKWPRRVLNSRQCKIHSAKKPQTHTHTLDTIKYN